MAFTNATGYNTAQVVRIRSKCFNFLTWLQYYPNDPIYWVVGIKSIPLLSHEKPEVNLPSEQRDLLFNFHGRHPGFGPSYYKDNVVRGKIIDIFTGLVQQRVCCAQPKTSRFMNPWRKKRVARSTDTVCGKFLANTGCIRIWRCTVHNIWCIWYLNNFVFECICNIPPRSSRKSKLQEFMVWVWVDLWRAILRSWVTWLYPMLTSSSSYEARSWCEESWW